ncbi:MAG: hypothetical protein COA65_01915 [Rhodospirillaceae bacterium]|nr:MAG: hypothetical protein COA65_01915 [Rhodospirillaceae bacterium]
MVPAPGSFFREAWEWVSCRSWRKRTTKAASPPAISARTNPVASRMHIADGSRHAMAPRVDWHEFEKELFAKKMAEILNQAAQKETFDRLVLVAPSKTLDASRKALGKTAREKTTAEINKDLTRVPIHELPAHLEAALKQPL